MDSDSKNSCGRWKIGPSGFMGCENRRCSCDWANGGGYGGSNGGNGSGNGPISLINLVLPNEGNRASWKLSSFRISPFTKNGKDKFDRSKSIDRFIKLIDRFINSIDPSINSIDGSNLQYMQTKAALFTKAVRFACERKNLILYNCKNHVCKIARLILTFHKHKFSHR